MKKLLSITCILAFIPFALFAECDDERAAEVLALNMYHEARGEGIDGMIMVAEVTLNRVDHPRYPNTICAVVYQRKQFSWVKLIRNHTPRENEAWEIAQELAKEMLEGDFEFFNTGATHYYNPSRVSRTPSWVSSFEEIGRVGNHVFYRM